MEQLEEKTGKELLYSFLLNLSMATLAGHLSIACGATIMEHPGRVGSSWVCLNSSGGRSIILEEEAASKTNVFSIC